MRRILACVLVLVLLGIGYKKEVFNRFRSFEPEAKSASGALFSIEKDGSRRFHCSGTEIGSTSGGDGVFLTARHCVASPETNEISRNLVVSFSDNEGGPFYDTQPIALSLTDDLALLVVRDGASIPQVRIRDNRRLRAGDAIFNVSFPLGTGKEIFHGEYMGPRFPILPMDLLAPYPQWEYSMPMNLTIAHGSSGSGVFSKRDRALIAVAVGTFEEGSYNIAIPADRVLDFLNDLKDNTVEKFVSAHPVKESESFWLWFQSHPHTPSPLK